MKQWIVEYSPPGLSERFVMQIRGETETEVRKKLTQYLLCGSVVHSVTEEVRIEAEEPKP